MSTSGLWQVGGWSCMCIRATAAPPPGVDAGEDDACGLWSPSHMASANCGSQTSALPDRADGRCSPPRPVHAWHAGCGRCLTPGCWERGHERPTRWPHPRYVAPRSPYSSGRSCPPRTRRNEGCSCDRMWDTPSSPSCSRDSVSARDRHTGPSGARAVGQSARSVLMARRSSMARYPSATWSNGRVRSKTLPGSISRFQMRSISSGRKRRTGAGPP